MQQFSRFGSCLKFYPPMDGLVGVGGLGGWEGAQVGWALFAFYVQNENFGKK